MVIVSKEMSPFEYGVDGNPIGYQYDDGRFNGYMSPNTPVIFIERFGVSDLFNIKFLTSRDYGAFINVNNNIRIDSPKMDSDGYYYVNHTELKNLPFSKLNQLSLGCFYAASLMNLVSITLDHKQLSNSFVLGHGDMIDFKIIKSIKIYSGDFEVFSVTKGGGISKSISHLTPRFEYTDVIIKPSEIPVYHSQDVATIYQTRDLKRFMLSDVNLGKGALKSNNISPSSTVLHLLHSRPGEKRTITVDPELEKKYQNIGSYYINDATYYDKEHNKICLGVGEGFKIGEIINPSFTGVYEREVKINLGDTIGDISYTQEKAINQPMLDPYDGRVVLEVNDTTEGVYENMRKYFDTAAIETIKRNDISLIGLERISKHEVKDI